MKSIADLISENKTADDIISELKKKDVNVPSWDDLEKMYNSKLHSITDPIKRPNKKREGKADEEVARIRLALQKLIVKRMSEFMFAIPVKRVYSYSTDNEQLKIITKAIEKIYKKVRINDVNLQRSKEFFACCEIATIWYLKEEDNNLYGFSSKYKLRQKTFSPKKGEKLYPLFDEFDDMVAFSVEYSKKIGDETICYFETYTADKIYKWKKTDSEDWKMSQEGTENIIGKINIIYTSAEEAIYEEVSHIVDDIEWTLSRNSDVISYNSAPILEVKGSLVGEETKGSERRVWRVEGENGGVRYVSWEQAIEAIKFHIDELLMLFFMQVQLPNLSFENLKGLSAMSGEARKTLLTDAHLKVGDEKGKFETFLDREFNVIKAFLKAMNISWANLLDEIEVEHTITPFIQNDEGAEIEKLLKANGGQSLMSQKESINRFGYSDNPEQTIADIQEEEANRALSNNTSDLFN